MATAQRVHQESHILLHSVAWAAYSALRDAPENYHLRMTYDRGDLEMMSPSKRHEQYGYMLGRLIDVWTEEWNIDVQSCRTMTCKREDLDRGLEPDNCYYIQNEALVRAKTELDLAVDPPPDLAVEVQLSKARLDKMDIYAAMGVPEVWRFDGQSLRVYALDPDHRYQPRETSVCLPRFPLAEVEAVLRRLGSASDTALVRTFRNRVRKELPPSN